jgi:hypothetical protein
MASPPTSRTSRVSRLGPPACPPAPTSHRFRLLLSGGAAAKQPPLLSAHAWTVVTSTHHPTHPPTIPPTHPPSHPPTHPGFPFFGLWYPYGDWKNPWKNGEYNGYR